MYTQQRIRDPLHNLILFKPEEFDDAMWHVLQTRPFQRLRRIKQLGFSDFVYPGATHSRFAHSVGVFHIARRLMKTIKEHVGNDYKPNKAQRALAAALVHDVGHGPFSHAFEDVGKKLGLKMTNHELVSDTLIRKSDIAKTLDDKLGTSFSTDVANIIGSEGAKDMYSAVVSSQFDADRLDYMRRDRLMTGTEHSAIDFEWLISNLEVDSVPYGIDETPVGMLDTFVLGPKAIHAAEAYVLGLFQLYPTVYLHKTTRGAEKLFVELLCKVITLAQDGSLGNTGLSANHPLAMFAKEPENIEHILNLDDTVIWGSLPMMADAKDRDVANYAARLRGRNLFKCCDIRERLAARLNFKDPEASEKLDTLCAKANDKIKQWLTEHSKSSILIDETKREPYKTLDPSKGPLNQIRIRTNDGKQVDLRERSKIVSAIETFKVFRTYTAVEDNDAKGFIESIIDGE